MLKKIARGMLRFFGLRLHRHTGGWWLGPWKQPDAPLFERRFGRPETEAAIAQAKLRWPDKNIVLLTDSEVRADAPGVATLRCGSDPVERIANFSLNDSVFIYACDSESIGLPYIRQVVDNGGRFFPVQVYTPARYSNIDEAARRVIVSEFERQRVESFLKFDFGPGDSLNLAQAIALTARLSGAYLEVGCYRGSSACVALAYMRDRAMQRRCFFLDVFDGFVYQTARDSADSAWLDTHATEGIEIVRKRIMDSANPGKGLHAQVLKCNIVEQPLPAEVGDIVVANVDVDLYEAVLASLQKVAERIVPGGIIVVEDPGHTPALIGSRLALEEFLASPIAGRFVPVYLESGQTLLIRIALEPDFSHVIGRALA